MENTAKLNKCKACEQMGEGKFCNNCGQAYAQHRISIKHMLHEAAHLFTHLDKGFGYTIKQLILRPGFMQLEYIEGKRNLYQKPFSMFFVCGTITALALYWINRAVILLHASGDQSEGHFYQHYFVLLQMCLLPVYAAVAYLIFRKKYTFAEFLVILLYNTSLLFLFTIMANALKLLFGGFETGYVEITFVLLYNIYTYINIFHNQNRVAVTALTLISSVLCFAIARLAMGLFVHFLMPHN